MYTVNSVHNKYLQLNQYWYLSPLSIIVLVYWSFRYKHTIRSKLCIFVSTFMLVHSRSYSFLDDASLAVIFKVPGDKYK